MVYKKDQGRNARLFAFWALFGLLAYGCIGELRFFLRRQITSWTSSPDSETPSSLAAAWVEDLPLIGTLDLAAVLALGILAVLGFLLMQILNRPQVVDLLIDTENEMKHVKWPSQGDTINGTVAVVITVVVMLTFLTIADTALIWFLNRLLSKGTA